MRTCNTHKYEVIKFKNTAPSYRYDGTEPLPAWQKKAREKLRELLGLPLESCPDEFSVEYEKQHPDYLEVRFTVQTEPGYYVPCHLLLPECSKRSVPLTVCLSGHCSGMHVALGIAKSERDERMLAEWPHRAFAIRAVEEGRAALVIEARNFGECSLEGYGTTCTEAAKIAILIGRTVIGERVWDAMRILDAVFKRYGELDASNVVCIGNSGGGTATYYLSCLDERITLSAPSCAVCNYETSLAYVPHCMCNHIPGIRKYFEMGDLGGMIAPRRLVIAAGKEDPEFLIEGTRDAFNTAMKVYEAAGVPERCALIEGNGGHFMYSDQIWKKIHEMGF